MLPYYVSPEQMMQDKAEYARKGIAKGKCSLALEYAGGLLLVAENHSATLQKISEVYDRIAFAGAGKYNEFENLRRAGIKHADLKGYSYGRQDVTARSLANAYSQAIGDVFSQQVKPLEVELLVVEVGEGADGQNELYRISFDGSITDEHSFAAIGGEAEEVKNHLKDAYREGMDLHTALAAATGALARATGREVGAAALEVAVLDRARAGRRFARFGRPQLEQLLSGGAK